VELGDRFRKLPAPPDAAEACDQQQQRHDTVERALPIPEKFPCKKQCEGKLADRGKPMHAAVPLQVLQILVTIHDGFRLIQRFVHVAANAASTLIGCCVLMNSLLEKRLSVKLRGRSPGSPAKLLSATSRLPRTIEQQVVEATHAAVRREQVSDAGEIAIPQTRCGFAQPSTPVVASWVPYTATTGSGQPFAGSAALARSGAIIGDCPVLATAK
jgi:hypothetical protein